MGERACPRRNRVWYLTVGRMRVGFACVTSGGHGIRRDRDEGRSGGQGRVERQFTTPFAEGSGTCHPAVGIADGWK